MNAPKPKQEKQAPETRKHPGAPAKDSEHGYVSVCGMAVDYDTILPRAGAQEAAQ